MEMTQEWINQYNKKCAEFLGSELKNDGQFDYWTYDHLGFDPMKIRGSSWVSGNFEFHSDWNWIMEVVEKIESIKQLTLETCNNWVGEFTIVIRYKSYSSTHYFSREIPRVSHGQDFRTKKEAVIQAIDQFIDWYNKQKESCSPTEAYEAAIEYALKNLIQEEEQKTKVVNLQDKERQRIYEKILNRKME